MNVQKQTKSNSGFSLVELMVVIAIIGILTTIAVPSLNNFQANARKVQAKTELSSMFVNYSAYQLQNGTYDVALLAAGYQPTGSPDERYYSVGYGGGSAVGTAGAAGSRTWSALVAANDHLPAFKCTTTPTPPAETSSQSALVLTAYGCPRDASQATRAGANALNAWTINENRALIEDPVGR